MEQTWNTEIIDSVKNCCWYRCLSAWSSLSLLPITGWIEHNIEGGKWNTRLHTAWIQSRSLENLFFSNFPQTRPDWRIEGIVGAGRQKIDCLGLDGVCNPCNIVFEDMGCCYHHWFRQKAGLSVIDADIERSLKKTSKMSCAGSTFNNSGK